MDVPTVILRAVAMLAVIAALGACAQGAGPTGASASDAGSAPGGIDTVTWPTDADAVAALVDTLPTTVGGAPRNPPTSDADSGDVMVTYGERRVAPLVLVSRHREWMTPAENFVGLYGWLGCDPSGGQFDASADVADLIGRAAGAGELDVALADGPSAWVECTSVVGADSGSSLAPDERSRNLMWSAGDSIYLVSAATQEDLEVLVGALVASAR